MMCDKRRRSALSGKNSQRLTAASCFCLLIFKWEQQEGGRHLQTIRGNWWKWGMLGLSGDVRVRFFIFHQIKWFLVYWMGLTSNMTELVTAGASSSWRWFIRWARTDELCWTGRLRTGSHLQRLCSPASLAHLPHKPRCSHSPGSRPGVAATEYMQHFSEWPHGNSGSDTKSSCRVLDLHDELMEQTGTCSPHWHH